MRAGPAPRHVCSFCGREHSEVALMFRSHIGGAPAMICDVCVRQHAVIVVANDRSPELAATLVAVHNAAVTA